MHPLETLEKIDPELMGRLKELDAMVYGPGVVPPKYKILMAMAFDAAAGADRGVAALAQRAMKAGATREEIAETLRVAFHLTGVGSLYTASAGLKDALG
jgi:alkylhydroperoxidase/carboxymuconolactone decarboxylase family protein YurZ